jgi:6-pyruvoyltetrahydropterin/6-carboxytetrahydropterin synthase
MQVFLEPNRAGEGANSLDKTGMVTDFRHLEWLKKWINTYIDHQFIIDKADPLYGQIVGERALVPVMVPDTDYIAGWHLDLSDLTENTPEYEYYEGFMVVNFVPTSERLSAWMAELVEVKMRKLGVRVHHIDWWETPKSRSVYYMDR